MQYPDIISTIALTLGVGWASGINLYAALFMLGLMGASGNMVLPHNLQILADPLVITAAGFMYMVEFFADKIPGVDTGWDTLHTFVRIPAGALLAAGVVGDINPAMQIAAGILGGGVAAGTHFTKASSRVLINTSPEPFSNWAASFSEDIAVFAGIWASVHHPYVMIAVVIFSILLIIWLLPRLWRGIKLVFRGLRRLFGGSDAPPIVPGPTT